MRFAVLELADIRQSSRRADRCIARFLDLDLTHHLADDDLDMLIVDINALLTVNLLDFLNDIGAHAGTTELIIVDTADAQNIVRAECAAGQLLTLIDMVAVLDENTCRVRQRCIPLFRPRFLAGDAYCKQRALLGLLDGNRAGNLGKDSHLLGLARLEQLFNTGKTLGDIVGAAIPPVWKVRMVS